ncbi:hypothetical protein LVJ82_00085 [Vitreoscilla massiliensis]|uniref:Uncharacterized protein n=1 Tax=Vitreoscilla massiliensis TaxID=1689272 RepID=A0ABY4E228_9NEIS|nr:hypothetical protein [Vitreoscilla massiliensis]UOO89420.1 hypothetical protein LVJ82_00085 [Vitreoscilla massiliensis]
MKTVLTLLATGIFISSLTAYANTINTDAAISQTVTDASQPQASAPAASATASSAPFVSDEGLPDQQGI